MPANLQRLNESSQEKLIQHYSLICRNQAVRRRSWSCESASGMLFCVNTMHVNTCSESVDVYVILR